MNYRLVEYLSLFVFPIIAITYVIVYSELFSRLKIRREGDSVFAYFMHCPICMGTWVGFFVGLTNALAGRREAFFDYVIFSVCGACAGTAIWYLITLFEEKQPWHKDEEDERN